jgi:hypothetical protein
MINPIACSQYIAQTRPSAIFEQNKSCGVRGSRALPDEIARARGPRTPQSLNLDTVPDSNPSPLRPVFLKRLDRDWSPRFLADAAYRPVHPAKTQ